MSAFILWLSQSTPDLTTRVSDIFQYITGVGVVGLLTFAINLRERMVRIETLLSGHIEEFKTLQKDVRRLERRSGEEVDP